MILGDEDALAKIAISYQQNTKKEDAVCEKHGCRYITVLKTG
ncbi:TPA: ATP-binding protein, partial [Streptococcus pyogenes]